MSSTSFARSALVTAVAAALIGSVWAQPARAQGDLPALPEGVEIIGDDASALTSLLLRSHTNFYSYPGAPETTVSIYPGAVAPELGFDLPLPEDTEVIGTIARSDMQEGGAVYLVVPGTPEDVIAFFRAELTAPDWEEADAGMMGGMLGGFTTSASIANTAFCGADDTILNLLSTDSVETTERAPVSEVMLNYTLDADYSPCDVSGEGMGQSYQLLPTLESPEGVRLTGSTGSGGGSGGYYTTSDLETQLTLGDLLVAYNAQLVEAGWELSNEAETGDVAVSNWTFTDEDDDAWVGLLLLIRTAEPETIYAMIRITKSDD